MSPTETNQVVRACRPARAIASGTHPSGLSTTNSPAFVVRQRHDAGWRLAWTIPRLQQLTTGPSSYKVARRIVRSDSPSELCVLRIG